MSGRIKQRSAANAADTATLSVNERILKDCHALYVAPDNGLIKIAASLGRTLLPPRRKITIMLLGNHSAGKSTFINWYIEEHVQRTGVAIETQGFTFVTSGKKRESLTGNATLHLYPQFKPLGDMQGVLDYLCTEISTSKQKKFSLVTFIDTPGLVDGDMKYPFDVNSAILWLGNLSDLIFVFFDPIGQALCKRTLNLVERLNNKHSERLRFYLSKADEAGHESDRQKVMMQIVQELCKRPGLNKCGFDMPTIYIPNPNKPSRCANQIEMACKEIEKAINQMIQNTLNTLERDCEQISSLIDNRLLEDNVSRSSNLRNGGKGFVLLISGLLLPVLLLLHFLTNSLFSTVLRPIFGNSSMEALTFYLFPVKQFWAVLPEDYHYYAFGSILMISLTFLLFARRCSRLTKTLTRKEKRELLEKRNYLHSFVKVKKHQYYEEYLKQSVGEIDL